MLCAILALTPSPRSCSTRAAEALRRIYSGAITQAHLGGGLTERDCLRAAELALSDIRDNPCAAPTVEAVCALFDALAAEAREQASRCYDEGSYTDANELEDRANYLSGKLKDALRSHFAKEADRPTADEVKQTP